MSPAIKESDWKIFRELNSIALDRFCERVLAEVGRAAAKKGESFHERYLVVFRLIKERER